jgi:hypothetical protein
MTAPAQRGEAGRGHHVVLVWTRPYLYIAPPSAALVRCLDGRDLAMPSQRVALNPIRYLRDIELAPISRLDA